MLDQTSNSNPHDEESLSGHALGGDVPRGKDLKKESKDSVPPSRDEAAEYGAEPHVEDVEGAEDADNGVGEAEPEALVEDAASQPEVQAPARDRSRVVAIGA